MEAAPLVEQHALRALEDAPARRAAAVAGSRRPRASPGRRRRGRRVAQALHRRRRPSRPELVRRSRSRSSGELARPARGARRSRRPAARRPGGASAYATVSPIAHAARAVPGRAAGHLPGPVGGPVVRRGQQRVAVDGEPGRAGRGRPAAARWSASAASASGSTSMNRDRCVRTPGRKRARPELGERVVPAVRGRRTLCAACAPPLNRTTARTGSGRRGAQPVDDRALAGVAVAEVDDDARAGRHSRPLQPDVPARPVQVAAARSSGRRSGRSCPAAASSAPRPPGTDGAPAAVPDRRARPPSRRRPGRPGPSSRSIASSPRPDGQRDRLADRVQVVELDDVLAEQVAPEAEHLPVADVGGARPGRM